MNPRDKNAEPTLHDVMDVLHAMNGRIDHIDGRLDGMSDRIDNIDVRLDGMTTRIDNIDERLGEVNTRLGKVETGLEDVKETLDAVVRAVDKDSVPVIEHGRRLTKLEQVQIA